MTSADNRRFHERSCRRAYEAFLRAVDDERWADALTYAVEALTFAEVGYGRELPTGALTHMSATVDELLSGDGRQVRPL